MENLIRCNWLTEIQNLINAKQFNLFRVVAKAGTCYVFSRELPAVPDAYIIAQIPRKFAHNPRPCPSSDFYKGSFWWAYADSEQEHDEIMRILA